MKCDICEGVQVVEDRTEVLRNIVPADQLQRRMLEV